MSSELDDNPSRWDEPVDRRTALAAAGGVGAALALGGLAGANRAFAGPAQNAGNVTAFFGQFGAIAEQEGIRRYVFRGFRGDVDAIFVPITTPTLFVDRVRAEAKAGKGNIDLLIGVHGDMVTFQNENLIRPINDVARQVKNLPPPSSSSGSWARTPSTTSLRRKRRTSWWPTGTCSSTCPRAPT